MTKLRISIATTLMVSSLICTAAPKLTKKEADAKCAIKSIDAETNCLKLGSPYTDSYCREIGSNAYKFCMRQAGYPVADSQPPPPNLHKPLPIKSPTPRPTPLRPAPVAPVKPIKQGSPSPTATPPITIYAKPKPTPNPHKDHHP